MIFNQHTYIQDRTTNMTTNMTEYTPINASPSINPINAIPSINPNNATPSIHSNNAIPSIHSNNATPSIHSTDTLNNTIKMYVCGPTVYDAAHLGHARTYVVVDILNRILTSIAGKNTLLVMNITDIDDKIINKAAELNVDWTEIAKKNEKLFFDSMAKLGVKLPDCIIRVSEVIPQIIAYVQQIIDNGFAYVTSDRSIYFDTDKYIKQGYKFQTDIDDDEQAYCTTLAPVIRLQKRNKLDFALWKGRISSEVGFSAEFMFESNKIVSWGRPGWHIECSTMIHETIGPILDIHFGGIDLKFPHHYNERLQAHAYYHPKFAPTNNTDIEICDHNDHNDCNTRDTHNTSNTPNTHNQWASQFIHTGHLCIKGLKMSKSLKNFTTIDEALNNITSNQLRWMFMVHKWTDSMDFCPDTISQIKVFDNTIVNFFNRIVNYPFSITDVTYAEKDYGLLNYYNEKKTSITDNLRVYKLDTASMAIFDLVNKVHAYIDKGKPNVSLVKKIRDWLLELLTKLGFEYQSKNQDSSTDIMSVIVATRSAMRKMVRDKAVSAQNVFQILDTERDVLLPSIGITLQDTKDSSLWFTV